MGRKPQKDEICDLILVELSDIKSKSGINFNDLFRRIKEKRGKFSFDTLSKYLFEMEQDGRIIRIVDVNSNKKIKPTYFYKNIDAINIRDEKINFNKIIMDSNTKVYQFSNSKLVNSDLFPKFNEIILKFLEDKMKLEVSSLVNYEFLTKDIILDNLSLFLMENPELKGDVHNFNDFLLLFYLNILESIIHSDPILEINYNLFFHINFYKIFASAILILTELVQKNTNLLQKLLAKSGQNLQIQEFSRDAILKLLLNQLTGEFKDKVEQFIQRKQLEEFSEKYRTGLKIL